MHETDLHARTKILIVDDNINNLNALDAILAEDDLDVVRASSGEDALRHLMTTEFAVAMLDVRMPDMDGFECAQLIRSSRRHADMPIIFVTAVATDMQFIFKGYSAGGIDYIVKPFEPAVVKAKVAVFVELFRSRQMLKMQIEDMRSLSSRLQKEIEEKTRALEAFTARSRLIRPEHDKHWHVQH